MNIKPQALQSLISLLYQHRLLSPDEKNCADVLAEVNFPFYPQVTIANSIHYHIHVPDIKQVPHQILLANNGSVIIKADGYIKYAFEGGVNCIFSHIPVAQKEKTEHQPEEVYLDHIGIDIRSEDKQAYITFQQIPFISSQYDYLFTRQGDGREPVKCCNMQVKEKYWVYPNEKLNYEFAFGPLVINENSFGVDLRPSNPFNKALEESSSCCTPAKQKISIFIN